MTLPPKPMHQDKVNAGAAVLVADEEVKQALMREGEARRALQDAHGVTTRAQEQQAAAVNAQRRLVLIERIHGFPGDILAVLSGERQITLNRETVKPFTRRGLVKVTSERFYGTRYDWTSDALAMMDILKGTNMREVVRG